MRDSVRLAWALLIGSVAVTACSPGTGGQNLAQPDHAAMAVLSILEGEWDWSTSEEPCTDNPFSLRFTPNRDEIHLTYARPRVTEAGEEPNLHVYRILGFGHRYVRGQIIGERRVTDAGEPVVWDFVILDRDAFCWSRTDWQAGGCTAPLIRCPGAIPVDHFRPGRLRRR
jgi:hypothetical protein